MEHFLASQVDMTYVLSLYPSIILPKTTMVHEPEKLVDISSDAYLSRGSSGLSDDMEPSPSPYMSESDAALESKKISHNMLMALIKFLQKKRYSIIEKATAEGTEEVVLDAVGDNLSSYSSSRFKKTNKVINLYFFAWSHRWKNNLYVKLMWISLKDVCKIYNEVLGHLVFCIIC